MTYDAIDLCAGIGWSVACTYAGITELGVEIMPEAIDTRKALGMDTIDQSIADLPDDYCAPFRHQIAGPPCQTFSMAGSGDGRRALAEVLRRVAHFRTSGVLIRGGSGDPRTWLVLEPLRLAVHGNPGYIVWEQVPAVLPVWDACADVLRDVGYSVWTGYLNSEQYGVPQTRKRAFLIARRDEHIAGPPPVTHSRYHNRTPERLDAEVLPWVSMATALGWGTTDRPSPTVTGGGTATGGAEPFGHAARDALMRSFETDGNNWVQRSNYTGRGANTVPSPVLGSPNLGARDLNQASSTVTSKGFKWASDAQAIRVTVEEAATLQTFPHPELIQGGSGKRYLQVGNMVPPLLGLQILQMFQPKTGDS